jgi:hypothetical protein
MSGTSFRVRVTHTQEASNGSTTDINDYDIDSEDDLDQSGNEYTIRESNGETHYIPKENVLEVSLWRNES